MSLAALPAHALLTRCAAGHRSVAGDDKLCAFGL